MRGKQARWILSGLVALGAVLFTWLIEGESSPLADYLRVPVGLSNAWRLLNALPFIAAAVISGNPHGGSAMVFVVLQFVQWLVVALVLSAVFSSAFRKRAPGDLSVDDK